MMSSHVQEFSQKILYKGTHLENSDVSRPFVFETEDDVVSFAWLRFVLFEHSRGILDQESMSKSSYEKGSLTLVMSM